MKKELGWFLIGCAIYFLIMLVGAIWFGSEKQLTYCLVATAVCVSTAFFTLIIVALCPPRPQELRPLIALAGSMFRVSIVLAVGWFFINMYPKVDPDDTLAFWSWIINFYMFTLGWEVMLVVRSQRRVDREDVSARPVV